MKITVRELRNLIRESLYSVDGNGPTGTFDGGAYITLAVDTDNDYHLTYFDEVAAAVRELNDDIVSLCGLKSINIWLKEDHPVIGAENSESDDSDGPPTTLIVGKAGEGKMWALLRVAGEAPVQDADTFKREVGSDIIKFILHAIPQSVDDVEVLEVREVFWNKTPEPVNPTPPPIRKNRRTMH